jgi:hypothetical protein
MTDIKGVNIFELSANLYLYAIFIPRKSAQVQKILKYK